ncbi:MAG: ROK family transcriptional regulator [bacterium]
METELLTTIQLDPLDRKILRLFRGRHATVAEISVEVNRSIPSVTSILRKLMRNGWIKESGEAASTGGRRPKLYTLVSNSKWAIGVDIGRRATRLCIVDLEGRLLENRLYTSPDLNRKEEALETVVGWVEEMMSSAQMPKSQSLGCALALPGLVDSRTGISRTYFNFDRPLRDILSERLNLPAVVVNDARAMAYGEYMIYREKGVKDLLFVNMGYGGIGMGIIVNDRLHFGAHRHAGEFGHLTVDPHGELCMCGKRGCLETVCSGSALVRDLVIKLKNNEKSIIHEMVGEDLDRVDTGVVVKAIRAGDQVSIDTLFEKAAILGRNLSVLYTLFDPQLIVIGGYISTVGKLLIDALRAAARASVIPMLVDEIEIVTSKLGDLAAAQGAARLLLEPLFGDAVIQHNAQRAEL